MSKGKFWINPNNSIVPYVGDFNYGDKFLATKYGWKWVFLKYLNALFRGVGQVIYCNNPFSGLIILACLYWADVIVGLSTTLAASSAILTAFIFQQDVGDINAGLTTYNAVLVGSVTASLWTPTFGEPLTLKVWGFIILAAALSVLVNIAIGNIFGSFKQPLPSFTFAFNIVTILLFTVIAPPRPVAVSSTSETTLIASNEAKIDDLNKHEILWTSVVRGILLSMGQVYAVNNLEGSILMYLSAIIYSPSVFMTSIIGASVGTVFGLVFADAPYQTVYDGVWGYNGILAAIGVGCFFFVLTWLSILTAVLDVVMAVIVQQALSIALTPLRLPVFTFPFVLSTIMFLEVKAPGIYLYRVLKISFPEVHKYEYMELLREGKIGQQIGNKPKTDNVLNKCSRSVYHKPTAPPANQLPSNYLNYQNLLQFPKSSNYLHSQPSGYNYEDTSHALCEINTDENRTRYRLNEFQYPSEIFPPQALSSADFGRFRNYEKIRFEEPVNISSFNHSVNNQRYVRQNENFVDGMGFQGYHPHYLNHQVAGLDEAQYPLLPKAYLRRP